MIIFRIDLCFLWHGLWIFRLQQMDANSIVEKPTTEIILHEFCFHIKNQNQNQKVNVFSRI